MLTSSICQTELWSDQLNDASELAKKDGSYHRQSLLRVFEGQSRNILGINPTVDPAPMGPDELDVNANKKNIYRFIVGIDEGFPKLMSNEEVQKKLNDPFTRLLLAQGIFPQTAKEVIEAFEKTQGQEAGLARRSVFLIGEGGKLPWNEETAKVNRTFRFTFAIEIKGGIGPDVLISTGTNLESTKGFLQLMSWDLHERVYHFFQRLGSFWIWSGSSHDALKNQTRQKGPFSGHINGGPVMKELELPWQNWHSMNATIELPENHPLKQTPYFNEKGTGDQFEKLVKTGMDKVNQARIDNAINNGIVKDFDFFMRQILISTNVNLISSSRESRAISDDEAVPLPFSFFANTIGLSLTDVDPDIEQVSVLGKVYLQSLNHFNFAMVTDGVTIPGDTHFAFFVPEASREDMDLLGKMIRHNMISKKMAASILMVDFPNPIYSDRRESLLQYVPQEIKIGNNGSDFDELFINNIKTSGKSDDPNLPEGEFLANWSIEDWQKIFESRLEKYFKNLIEKIQIQESFNDFVRLAEYRRSRFIATPLYEFDLTFAKTNIDITDFSRIPLKMKENGMVMKEII